MPKDDLRIEVNGLTDHLNALLGLVRASAPNELLHQLQQELMVIMSHIATPDGQDNPRELHTEVLTQQMEQAIDELTEGLKVGFTLPGDTQQGALIHVARTLTRTVERRLWTLQRTHPVDTSILQFFNRLSDYLFALALFTDQHD